MNNRLRQSLLFLVTSACLLAPVAQGVAEQSFPSLSSAAGLTPIPYKEEAASNLETTYLFVGNDISADVYLRAEKNGIVIVREDQYPSIRSAVEAVKEGDSNIILLAHGSETGKFEWGKNNLVAYKEFFSILPRNGVRAILVENCFGGSAIEDSALEAAPLGALVQTTVGKVSVDHFNPVSRFNRYLAQGKTWEKLMLAQRIAFDPSQYLASVQMENAIHGTSYNSDPLPAIPTFMGIGGKRAQILWHGELDFLQDQFRERSVELAAWARAVDMVRSVTREMGVEERWRDRISQVVSRIQQGSPITEGRDDIINAEAQNFGFILTLAYLMTSGQLEQFQKNARQNPSGAFSWLPEGRSVEFMLPSGIDRNGTYGALINSGGRLDFLTYYWGLDAKTDKMAPRGVTPHKIMPGVKEGCFSVEGLKRWHDICIAPDLGVVLIDGQRVDPSRTTSGFVRKRLEKSSNHHQ